MTVKYAGDPDIQVNLDIIVSEHLNLLLFGTKTTGVKACPHPHPQRIFRQATALVCIKFIQQVLHVATFIVCYKPFFP